MRSWSAALAVGLALILLAAVEGAPSDSAALTLSADQKEFLWQEPILVSVAVPDRSGPALPVAPGEGKATRLRFEVDPAVKPRPKAKALPLEAQAGTSRRRLYDLSEWFLFPDKGGPWKVRAVLEQGSTVLRSDTLTVAIRKPAKDDKEQQPVGRIHHTPWSNYETNAFCGDTFDLVKRWPDSRLAKYCHYWNGRHLQHKKEHAKALESYRVVVEKYPDFALADHAAYGMVECLMAQKKFAEARQVNATLRRRLDKRPGTVGLLAEQIDRELAQQR
jgi:hypothetical protein